MILGELIKQPLSNKSIELLAWVEAINGLNKVGGLTALLYPVIDELINRRRIVNHVEILELSVLRDPGVLRREVKGALGGESANGIVAVEPRSARVGVQAVQPAIQLSISNTKRVEMVMENIPKQRSIDESEEDDVASGWDHGIESLKSSQNVGLELRNGGHTGEGIDGVHVADIVTERAVEDQHGVIRRLITSQSGNSVNNIIG
jgi:hypothetical protein